MAWALLIIKAVYPSFGEMATELAAVVPPAPGRFSTTTDCPRISESGRATMRAAMSVPPPGPKPTVMRIGRVGQSCAGAGAPASATTSTTASAGIPMPAKYPRRAMASSYFRVIGPLRLLVLDRIAQRADPFDLDLACIAVPHQHRRLARKANAGR